MTGPLPAAFCRGGRACAHREVLMKYAYRFLLLLCLALLLNAGVCLAETGGTTNGFAWTADDEAATIYL